MDRNDNEICSPVKRDNRQTCTIKSKIRKDTETDKRTAQHSTGQTEPGHDTTRRDTVSQAMAKYMKPKNKNKKYQAKVQTKQNE